MALAVLAPIISFWDGFGVGFVCLLLVTGGRVLRSRQRILWIRLLRFRRHV
jgi:hypothetical protein